MRILGIITARGGSKSIPRKNIKELAGKPLIAYTIEAARDSGVFDRLILTTDDEEIAAVGREWGVEVPFMRPGELAQDTTPTLPVLQHALVWLKEQEGYEPEAVMILQPTTPFRKPEHIRGAAELLDRTGADSVVSVVEIPGNYNPHWAFRADEELRATLYLGGAIKTRIKRRQDLPRAYSPNGMIYLFRPRFLFDAADPNFYGDDVRTFVVSEELSINIDSPEDWTLAEREIEKLRNLETKKPSTNAEARNKITTFKDLVVWQKAHQLMLDVHEFTKLLPQEERYNRISQLHRSVDSIPANIAEGFGRYHYKENVQFCRQARGSLEETCSHIAAVGDLRQAPESSCMKLLAQCDEVRLLLNGYIKSTLQRRDSSL